MKVGDDGQLVRDPLDHHGLGLYHPGNAKLLSSLECQLAVVFDVMRRESVVGDQVGVEGVDEATEGQAVPPAGGEVGHLDVGILGQEALGPCLLYTSPSPRDRG